MQLERIELNTKAPALLSRFYGETLGLPTSLPETDRLEIRAGASLLVFRRGAPDWQGIYHVAFNIPENQMEEAKRWLLERVSTVPNTDGNDIFVFESWNAHAVYFYDPAGNILEFITRHDLTNAATAPFSAAGILCASEIGLVTDDVQNVMKKVDSGAGVHPYRPGSDSFAPLGDENGLFIVVKTGREWFAGDGQFATINPLAVEARNQRGERFRLEAPNYDVVPIR